MTKSTKEKLTEMMEAAQVAQKEAIEDAATFFASEQTMQFRTKLEELLELTLPGSAFEQVFGSLIRVLDSTKQMCDNMINPPKVEESANGMPVIDPMKE